MTKISQLTTLSQKCIVIDHSIDLIYPFIAHPYFVFTQAILILESFKFFVLLLLGPKHMQSGLEMGKSINCT